MAKHNVGMVIMMIIAILVGFVSMVTSAIAASDVRSGQKVLDPNKANKDLNEAHKTATISAVLQGVVIAVIFIILMIYLFRKDISKSVQGGLQDADYWIGNQKIGY